MSTQTPQTSSLIERMFAAGAHFGFSKSRRHPSVAPYIYAQKEGTDIFDLTKTSTLLEAAAEVLRDAGANGKTILVVGTKDEASALTHATATAMEMPHVTNRWIGGMLTNFEEIKKRIERMKTLQKERESGELERKYTKKERVVIGREFEKLQFNFGGMVAVEKRPAALLVVDPRHDAVAVAEANKMGIPVIGVMSSDCDATKVAYPVIVNDAQKASLDMALAELAKAYQEGRKTYTPAAAPARPERSPRRSPARA